MIQGWVPVCCVRAVNKYLVMNAQLIVKSFSMSEFKEDRHRALYEGNAQKNITAPRNRQRGSRQDRWVPSAQAGLRRLGHRRDEHRWADMLDPNLMGAESGDPTFMWCASLVTQQDASLSHAFDGRRGCTQ